MSFMYFHQLHDIIDPIEISDNVERRCSLVFYCQVDTSVIRGHAAFMECLTMLSIGQDPTCIIFFLFSCVNGIFLGYTPYKFQVLNAIRQRWYFLFWKKKWEYINTKQRKTKNSQDGDEHDVNFWAIAHRITNKSWVMWRTCFERTMNHEDFKWTSE